MKELQIYTNAAEIKADRIPDSDLDGIARALLEISEVVMAQPGMQERFEEWKRKRAAQTEAIKEGNEST